MECDFFGNFLLCHVTIHADGDKWADRGGRGAFLLSIHGATAGKSSAPYPAEPELPSARAELRAVRSAARSAAADVIQGGWASRPPEFKMSARMAALLHTR
jgi:hypothetical protein